MPELPGILAGAISASVTAFSWKTPAETSLKDLKQAPSWLREVEWGGIEPGVMPPMSAWWPLEATKKTGLSESLGVVKGEGGQC